MTAARQTGAVAASMTAGVAGAYVLATYREQIAAVVGLSFVGAVAIAVLVGCVWLAARWTERPPMTEHLRDEASVLLERSNG